MGYAIAPKVYDIDYSFIIKNYLSPELWTKTWTLFVYKDFKATLELYSIRTRQPIQIEFLIRGSNCNNNVSISISYDLTNSNLTILKNQINGAIRDCINYVERAEIRNTNEYDNIGRIYNEQCDRLREIAEEFLDDNGIYLDEVREAYIDKYVDDNDSLWNKQNEYVDCNKYKILTELWLVFYKCIGRDDKYQEILNINVNNSKLKELLEEISNFETMFTEEDLSDDYREWLDDKRNCLESIS